MYIYTNIIITMNYNNSQYQQYQQYQPPPQQQTNINYNVSNLSKVQEVDSPEPLDFETIIKQVKPTLSKASIKIYTTNLTKLYKYVNDTYDDEIKDLDFIYNTTKINKFLENKALKTKANYYNNIMTLYSYIIKIEKKEDPKIHKLYFDMEKQKQAYNYEIKQNTIKRNHSKEKQEKILDIKIFLKFLKKLKDDNFQAFVMFYLLYYFPYRNEIASIKIITLENYKENYNTKEKRQRQPIEDRNIIFQDTKKDIIYIIRNNYKTHKTYGEITSEISKEKNHKLYKMLNVWIKGRGTNDYLFSRKDGKSDSPFDGSGLSAYLGYHSRKYLDVKLTSASIFKIVIANFTGNPADMLEFIEDKGEQRGTNVNSLISHYVYKKNSTLEYSEEDDE